MTTTQIAQLSDDSLIAETARAAERERVATADLIRLLLEVDRRRLYLARGYSSMFAYCTRALRLSEQAAYSRITAARAARRFPRLLDELETGHITLSSVGLLAPHLDDGNVESLIDAARDKSTRDVERIVAGLHAQPDVPVTVRALPSLPTATTGAAAPPADAIARPLELGRTRPAIAPITPRRYLLRLTIGETTHQKLQPLRSLMRHTIPSGDEAEIVDRALSLLLEHVETQKAAMTRRVQRHRDRASSGRHIPADVRRAVWARDAGRCTFAGIDGRCAETAFLEFHHVVSFAAGGPATVANIELRCRAHNAHEARLVFEQELAVGPRLATER